MIHTEQDFFNKVTKEIRSTYFPNENHGTTENKHYHNATKAIEDFNNGVLTYRLLITRLAKACDTTSLPIHNIVSNHIKSFGAYKYKPSKN